MRISWLKYILVAFCGLGIAACSGGGSSFSVLPTSDEFVQDSTSFNNKLDILFVVNAEPSMSSFQAELAASFSSFMQLFQTKGFDYKISVITASAYLADPTLNGYDPLNIDAADFNDFDGITHSNVFVIDPLTPNLFDVFTINAQPDKNPAGQDGRAFSSFRQALQSNRPINAGFLRPDSYLAIVIVDNQDDFSGNGRCAGCSMNQKYNAPTLDALDVYINFLDTLTGTSGATARYNVSAMTQIATPCQGGTNMTRIMDLVNQTNGVLGDICQADFGASMADMSNHIAMLSSQFFLDRIPIEATIAVTVNGVSVPQDAANGWTYDSAANSIVFHGSAIPPQGASITVDYDPVSLGS